MNRYRPILFVLAIIGIASGALAMGPAPAATLSDVPRSITAPLVAWLNAHPWQALAYFGVTAFLLFVVLPLFVADVYCSFKLAGLRAMYPNRATRTPETSAQMARLDFLVRSFDRLLRAATEMPLVGKVLGRILDRILPAPESTLEARPSEMIGLPQAKAPLSLGLRNSTETTAEDPRTVPPGGAS